MTKLPDEIEKDIHNLCNELRIVYNIEGEVPVHMEDRVYKALQKHLTHPTEEGIEKEEPMCTHMDGGPYCHDCAREARIECEKKSNEVKPPTKDTIEKIEYLSREEIMVLRKTDKERFDAVWSKLNELVDTVNHQQEQIQQLLSGK